MSKATIKSQGAILRAVLDNLKPGQTVTIGEFPTVTVSYADREEGHATNRWDFVRDYHRPEDAEVGVKFQLCGPKFHAESAWSLSEALRIALDLLNDGI